MRHHDKRPDWARTHHTKPRRVSDRRERGRLQKRAADKKIGAESV